MNETGIVSAETIGLIGRIKGIIIKSYGKGIDNLAILSISNKDVEKSNHKIRTSPVFLAQQLGRKDERPEHLLEENRPEDEKLAQEFDEKLSAYIAERGVSSVSWLRGNMGSLMNKYYRAMVEDRIEVNEKGNGTGYLDKKGNMVPHTATGYALVEMEELDDYEIADVELNRTLEAGNGNIQVGLVDIAEFKAINMSAAEERRNRIMQRYAKPAKAVAKPAPVVEDAVVEEPADEQVPF